VRARHVALGALRNVKNLGELLVAILAEKDICTHGRSPNKMIAPPLARGNPGGDNAARRQQSHPNRDFAPVQGRVLVIGLTYALVNLLTDLTYR
jgi:hypothetical protein